MRWADATVVRFGIFAGVFAIVAVAEVWLPRRDLRHRKWQRWAVNFGLIVVDIVVQRGLLGAAAITAAVYAQAHQVGLLAWVDWPWAVKAVIGFVLLDCALYLQHRVFHALPWLWRLHRVHHTDPDLDASSGLRFHPGEIILSLIYKAIVVLALGADLWTVLAFEATLNAASIFTHGNIRIPDAIDAGLREVIITPDMHRIHHSIVPAETDSNFGFFLSVWDRIFGTARAAPAAGQEALTLGIPGSVHSVGLWRLLAMPFQR
jgi:sterol desaturase/sphingolipid hydroxylase (fatty acid hydroxylase superfamily)